MIDAMFLRNIFVSTLSPNALPSTEYTTSEHLYGFDRLFFAQLIIIMTIIIMILTQSVIKHLQCECHHWEKKNVLYCEIQIERNKNTHKHKNEYCAHFYPGGKRFAHTIRNHLCAPFHHRFFCCFVVCRFLFHFNWWLCAIKQNYLRI